MVQSEIAGVVAKDKGITVTDAQRDTFYATVELYPALAKNPVTAGFMVRFADASTILTDQAAATAFSDLLAKTPVRVNPRFGVWDDTKHGLVDGSTGSLSEAAPTKG